jgi:dienelactone hydrolase
MSRVHSTRIARGALALRVGWLAGALLPLCLATAAHAVDLEVYGRLPRIESVALSPDGAHIAFVKTEGDTRVVAVVSLADHVSRGSLRAGDQKLRDVYWADNAHLLIFTSFTSLPLGLIGSRSEWLQLQVYDLKSSKVFMVPGPDSNETQLMNVIIGRPMVRHVKDHAVLYLRGMQFLHHGDTHTPYIPGSVSLVRVDLDTRASRVVQQGRVGSMPQWLVDEAGDITAEESYDNREQHWSIHLNRDGHSYEALSGQAAVDIPELLGWGPSAGTLLLEQLEDGNSVWRLLSLKDGSLGEPMAERQALQRPLEDPLTNRMIGGVHLGDREEYVFFDPRAQELWQGVVGAFRGEHVGLESLSADLHKLIVRVEGERDGYCYMLIDTDSHRATPIGEVYEGVKQPFEVRRITYPASDGLQIPAYLTVPRGREPRALPLVVLPHGGPEWRSTADFYWWSQALADQGYAVLEPNYRGSALGRAFVSRGYGEWGRKMQTDLSDGVRYLARQGLADPARVCIVGGSYGGYAALAGATLDRGVYRCAVSVAGMGDPHRMLRWVNEHADRSNNITQRYWDRFMGAQGPDDPALDAISPVKHVDAVNVPVLLIHGRDDTVVPFEQSQLMYDALHGAGKDVQLVPLKKEDHWLSRSETRLQMLQSSVAFLRSHNPPD